ncbi:MAG TPA: YihY/virulence factor BrkB family protein [Polyangiaceae bacterium]|nr:YihY/virulence factor BrkB family protein [Polyangiaceae bacterium]
MRRIWDVLRRAISDFSLDDVTTLAAALAFYSALGLAPLVLIVIKIASVLDPHAQDHVVTEISDFVGAKTGEVISQIVAAADRNETTGTIAAVLGLATLAFSATGVFSQLQASLNRIWAVQSQGGLQIGAWVTKRLLSFGMVLAIAFLLLVSLVISAALSAVLSQESMFWGGLNLLISFALSTVLFALMFRYLPDVEIRWREVWTGAAVTAALFSIGKLAIGMYLGRSTVGSAYGAAGSFVVLLLWVYYSALVFFFGAEITEAYAHVWRKEEPIAGPGAGPATARQG